MGDRNIPGTEAGCGPPGGYRKSMMSRYPDGATGAALLLLRVSLALTVSPSLLRIWPVAPDGWLPILAAIALALALVSGAATRPAAFVLLLVLAAGLFGARGELLAFAAACAGASAALALTGPGAFSIDSHRFGRRVIRLDARSPERGSHD